MAADYESKETRADHKVFRKGRQMIIGFSGSFRVGQLLRHSWKVPRRPSSVKDDMEFMVRYVVASIKKLLMEEGIDLEDYQRDLVSEIMIGYRGKLFVIHDDYHVSVLDSPFNAIGDGASYAKGALELMMQLVNEGEEWELTDMVERALLVAEKHSTAVQGPFHLEVLTYDRSKPS